MTFPVWPPYALSLGSQLAGGFGSYLEGRNQRDYQNRVLKLQEEAQRKRAEAEAGAAGVMQVQQSRDGIHLSNSPQLKLNKRELTLHVLIFSRMLVTFLRLEVQCLEKYISLISRGKWAIRHPSQGDF